MVLKINQPANKHLRNLNFQFQGFIKQLNLVRISVNIRKNSIVLIYYEITLFVVSFQLHLPSEGFPLKINSLYM